jgi:glycosyltransferase involved in cell wall biosynthesis
LRIGINALYLLPGKVGGTEIYLRSLVDGLSRLDKRNKYFIFVNNESSGIFDHLRPEAEIVSCPIRASNRAVRVLWEQLILPFQVRMRKVDVLLSAGMTAPFFCSATSVLVIHDLQHINQPWNFSIFYLPFLKVIIYLSARSSDAIIAISKKVKSDVEKHYNIASERVSVVYNGIDRDRFFPRNRDEVRAFKKKYGLPERFILYPAASLPHKNHIRLLESFRTVKEEQGGLKLLLIGARDYGNREIEEKIKELGLSDDVIFRGWLSYEDIPAIYCASLALVFPSLHEGFGLPVIEAMASGVPVVCSRIEPLTEVADRAAFFVDPLSPVDIAQGILSVVKDDRLRERLIKQGLERSREFSWETTASKTLRVLQLLEQSKKV